MTPAGAGDERPPRPGLRMLVRALLAAGAIALLVFVASATAGVLGLERLADRIGDGGPPVVDHDDVTRAEAGEPQTILLLGSDRRWAERDVEGAARSDTIMLVRLDSDERGIAVLSIPRDLRVTIPGVGERKINEAYSEGGAALTLKTVKALTGLDVHHVVEVDFRGFREVVRAIGCVYVDVDRRYLHSNAGLPQSQHYAEIDIQPGLQRLCGQDALDLARFRHADNDLMRAARQQDVMRAAKDQVTTGRLIRQSDDLIDIFARASRTDRDLSTGGGLAKLLKLGLYTAGEPVRQVRFPAGFERVGDADYVVASEARVRRTVRRFLHAPAPARPRAGRRAARRRRGPRLVRAPAAAAPNRSPRFPLRLPTRATPNARYETPPRVYTIRDRAGRPHDAYRLVATESRLEGRYYGVQGSQWRSPPPLANPTDVRRVKGRRLELFETGGRLRYVAWRTDRAVYWIANTLDLHLRNDQMLALAASLSR